MRRTNFIDLNPDDLRHYQFMVILDECNGNCYTLHDPSSRIKINQD